MNTKKSTDILVCLFWWLTISLVFPFQARKRGLVKRSWARILLTLLSPAAIITYTLIWFASTIAHESEFSPDDLVFKTRDDIVLLTGLTSIPTVELNVCWRDPLEGTVSAKYVYVDEPSPAFLAELEARCTDDKDIYWKRNSVSGHDFEQGWYAGRMEKPSGSFPDNVCVKVHFTDKGIDIQYEYQPFSFEGLCSQDLLLERTGVHFPPFEIVNYCWHPVGPDAVATMTILLQEKPGRAFIQELKAKWADDGAGGHVWMDGIYDVEGIPEKQYTICVKEGSQFVTFNYASY